MKRFFVFNRIFLLLFMANLLLITAPSMAQTSTIPTQALPEWDRLTPQQRETMIAPIRDRWNQSPNERSRMLERSQRWVSMTPEQRQQAQQGRQRYEQMTPEQREQAKQRFLQRQTLSPEERKVMVIRFQNLAPDQKQGLLKELQAVEAIKP